MAASIPSRPIRSAESDQLLQPVDKASAEILCRQAHTQEGSAVVHQVLRSEGEPLDATARETLEPRFGHDFSDVRVHKDSTASRSAEALDAAAYTVGNRIVFHEGHYAPHTDSGQKLIAHELAHVQQQAAFSSVPETLNVGAVSSVLESEAHQAAEATTSQQTTFAVQQTAAPQVSRSLLGGLLGGGIGAVIGAGLGFLVGGPLGAVVGGLGGFVAGAAIGNSATTKERHLDSTKEEPYAREIFQGSLEYSRITITRDSMLSAGAPRTIGNTIHLRSDWGHFVGNTMELTEKGLITLVHEMGHVWQYQHAGLGYIPKSLLAQLNAYVSTGSRNNAYQWKPQHQAGVPWEKWNPEQQAEAIETYNASLRRANDGTASLDDYQNLSILLPYIEKVRRGEGAA